MAVDAMTWLHKAAFGCCVDLALGKPTQTYIRWCCRRAATLSAHGVTPVFVLDGRPAACKRAVDDERRAARDKHRKRGLELHREGHAGRALKEFRQSIAISDEMLRTFFDVMTQNGYQVLFAPNEADSQCAFLAISGQVAGVISEDSDLLVFGAPLVVFKLDEEGQGLQVQYDELSRAGLLPPTLFTHWRFVTMAVLAGCDYCPSLVGVGVKTACKIVSQAKDVDHVSVRGRG
ncbi:MAG: uncharacterized protein KVP18_001968 [Porospora cf. gigantea A]|uniref:uncharacterized protein n=2 Tax=Porospora cf. gigantea A TaxID=2853593 RepID=UPI0035597F9D|nr:MAG: hypothetical protein KVP18_001968 [Porospora cf. gigantea A]